MKKGAPKRGKLIGLEGTGGRSMALAAKRLQRHFRQGKIAGGVSEWDASALFFQIVQGARGIPAPSPRTLLLLYATDLAFRLRWEIRPALEEGTTVIAAPYVQTAFAFGRAAGLPHVWLRGVFEFAPAADICYRVPEDSLPLDRRGKPSDSFLEFSFMQLRNGPGYWDIEEIRRGFLAHLKTLESRGKCNAVTHTLLDPMAPAG